MELEHTAEFLQANVSLDGVVAEVGDQVLVHDAPTSVPFGEHRFFERRATLTRANALDRLLARASAYLELTELYEVGFDGRRSGERLPRPRRPERNDDNMTRGS